MSKNLCSRIGDLVDAGPRAGAEAELATRAELAERFRVSVSTLERLWAERATNNHPSPADSVAGQPGRARPRWVVSEWERWYTRYQAGRRGVPRREGDPEVLGGLADFARVCGHADASTVSHWLTERPDGFPEPDEWRELPGGGRRPLWKLGRMWAYADRRIYRGQKGGRRRQGEVDRRPELARRALADHPGARNADLIRELQKVHPASRSTWNRILNAERDKAE